MFFKGKRPRRGSARPSKNRKSSGKPKKIVLESLEPRVLLSTINVAAGVLTADLNATPDAVTITQTAVADDGGIVVALNINGTVTTYGSSTVGIQSLNLAGLGGDDSFTFATKVDVPVVIDGGDGTDSIVGPNADNEWTVTGLNAGHTNGDILVFTNVENLTGGTGADNFVIMDVGSVSGT